MQATPHPAERPPAASMYFPTLDGLRLVAFLLVFVHHVPPSSNVVLAYLHECGWVGVSLFLALSAYLLTTILTAEHQRTGAISARRFYIRRGLRIWPLYYAFVLVLGAFAAHRLGLTAGPALRIGGLLVFCDNLLSGVLGYNPIPYAGHLWTVGLEEQFYLVLPFVLAAWLRQTRAVALRRIALVWLVFVLLRVGCVLLRAPHPLIWTSVFSADSILVGILLALGSWPPPTRGWGRLATVAFGVGALLVAGGLPVREPGPAQVLAYALVGVGAGLFCRAALHEPGLAFLGSRPLRYLGKISYGLYVFHILGIGLTEVLQRRGHPMSWAVQASLALGFTIVLSAASYELFEKPFLRLKARFETIHTRPI